MWNWSIGTVFGNIFDEARGADWGRDINSKYSSSEIVMFTLHDGTHNYDIFPQSGVIITDKEEVIDLGILLNGYPYSLSNECNKELKKIIPFTIAEYDILDKNQRILDRHVYLKYKITHILDRATKERIPLDSPIIKEYSIRVDNGFIIIC